MPFLFTVSPDFSPEHLSGWYIFNTWLQKALNEGIRLETFDGFSSQREAILADRIDLIYANPYDAATLTREKGFVPVAKPSGKPDEAVVAVSDTNPAQVVEDLAAGVRVASTDDPDVRLMGMIMLEPADLGSQNTESQTHESYVLVAKALLQGKADVGLFLAEAFNGLSGVVRKQLRPLVTSQIHIISHTLMAGPKLADRREELQGILTSMHQDAKGPGVLESLGFPSWEPVDQEEMEFMVDLMDTLET